ncbi:ATP-dependent DNA helicase yku80 [Clarireedia jacksonii]
MTDKQATVYVVDVGKSLGECHNGRTETDLEYAMRYVWDKITLTMSAARATDAVGIVGLRTDGTDNGLHEKGEEGYENITVLKPLGQFTMSHLEQFREEIKPSNTDAGDAISAIVVATDMIEKHTTLKSGKPGKFARKLVLVTDGQGNMDGEALDDIAKHINECDITLVIIGVDFDDADFGFKEEDKDGAKAANEKILRSLAEQCTNGIFGTTEEAIQALAIPVVKVTRPYSTFEGQLTLGDSDKYPETSMSMDIVRYFKTKIAKPPSASSFVVRTANEDANNQVDEDLPDAPPSAGDLAAVRSSRTYKVNDPNAPGGKRDVDREELSKGYEYGSTVVPINESDTNVTQLETFKSFSIIGFVPNTYERYLNMGESCITIAQRSNEKARMALSSFAHALHELEACAVARIVLKDGKDPAIILLAPLIEPDLEALVDVPLPFAEDVRTYRFAPLDRVINSSGGLMEKHKNLPKKDLKDAMSEFVDSMDLSTAGKDDEGEPMEYMTIEDTYSPVLHRINQAIRRRAVKPDEGVTPPAEILTKWANPPPELVSQSKVSLERLVKAADLKKVPPKTKAKRTRETIKPLSGLDVDAILGREKRQKTNITVDNAVPEFKQRISSTDSVDAIKKATKEMGEAVCTLITKSTGNSKYGQAAEYMRTMRTELIELIEPDIYNNFLREFKVQIKTDALGDHRKEFWFDCVRKMKLGLIHKDEAENTSLTEEEARSFYSLST